MAAASITRFIFVLPVPVTALSQIEAILIIIIPIDTTRRTGMLLLQTIHFAQTIQENDRDKYLKLST